MSNTPSDAEIRGLAAEGNGVYQDDETAVWEITDPSLIKFARAVLAKWGTPQLVNLGFTIENRAGIYVLVWEAGGCQPATSAEVAMWKALAAVQQPVVREPLTPEQVKIIVLEAGYDCIDAPDPERAAFISGMRHAERAHGITQRGVSNAE